MNKPCFAYISSWSHGESECGLRLYSFDTQSGKLSLLKIIDEQTDFNVSVIDERRNILYALDESINLPGRNAGGGRIFAFRLDAKTGDPELISCLPTCCASPSYLAIDSSDKYIVVSCFGGKGSVTKLMRDAFGAITPVVEYDDAATELFTINADGSIGKLTDAVLHYGSGPDPKRQMSPHPHSVEMSPSGKLFAVCDKGNDRVYMYSLDRERERLEPASAPHICKPGSQPRYCRFHPELPYFYHNNEGTTDLCAYRYSESGQIEQIGVFPSLLPENRSDKGRFEQQGLCIDRRGDYIYDLVRAEDELVAVFKVDRENGRLKLIQNVKVRAVWPRGCTLSPDGRFLSVCGMKSGNVLMYAVGEDGTLTDTGNTVLQPNAGHITFFQT